MKLNENHSKGSGDMKQTGKCYDCNDGLTDEGHSYNPNLLSGGGLISLILQNKKNAMGVVCIQ